METEVQVICLYGTMTPELPWVNFTAQATRGGMVQAVQLNCKSTRILIFQYFMANNSIT